REIRRSSQRELFLLFQDLLHSLRERGEARSLKQCPKRHVDVEALVQARHDLGGQEGMPARLEEIVQGAYPLDSEQLLPDLGDRALAVRGGFGEGRGEAAPALGGRGSYRGGRGCVVLLLPSGLRLTADQSDQLGEITGRDYDLTEAAPQHSFEHLDAFRG